LSSSDENGRIDPLARIIGELEDQLAPISAERAQLEAQIGDLIKREERIKAGITALRQGAPRRPSPPRGTVGSSSGNVWTPSQKVLDDVYAVVARAGEPLTVKQIGEQSDTSPETVRKAIDYLRADQKIRLAGTAMTKGAPKLYAVMPS
jgi:Bacterial regulatory proteins, gntR family